MEDRKINELESLDIITVMIGNARKNIRAKINCNTILVFGYSTVAVSLLIWLLKMYDVFIYSSFLWFLIPIVSFPSVRIFSRKETVPERSYLDISLGYITILFGIVCSSIAISSIWVPFPVLFIEGILFNIWIVVVGLLIKFRPVVAGGIAGLLLTQGLLFVQGEIYQIPLFAMVPIFSIIIPGHIFKKAITHNV